jgi:hypothetical protein
MLSVALIVRFRVAQVSPPSTGGDFRFGSITAVHPRRASSPKPVVSCCGLTALVHQLEGEKRRRLHLFRHRVERRRPAAAAVAADLYNGDTQPLADIEKEAATQSQPLDSHGSPTWARTRDLQIISRKVRFAGRDRHRPQRRRALRQPHGVSACSPVRRHGHMRDDVCRRGLNWSRIRLAEELVDHTTSAPKGETRRGVDRSPSPLVSQSPRQSRALFWLLRTV